MTEESQDKQEIDQITEVLDKMLQLKKYENKSSFIKRCLFVTGCIIAIIIVILFSVIMYKNNFIMESLVSLLLAFFSIFISIFFYFKADETSSRFYETSYNFMKDISVTLGKIEERFGEKLNTLNDKVAHLSVERESKQKELKSAEDEKQILINELMEKAKLSEDEKNDYKKRIEENENEISDLRRELRKMRFLERNINSNSLSRFFHDSFFSEEEKFLISHASPSVYPVSLREKLYNADILDFDDHFTMKGKKLRNLLRTGE